MIIIIIIITIIIIVITIIISRCIYIKIKQSFSAANFSLET